MQLGTPEHPLRVAVIGSGPSGFYAAEHLQEQEHLEVQIDMYDRLPTPFGLVRGGVAPDHQKIKSVTRVYDKIAAHPEFRFYGNVEMGRDLTHADLSALLPRDHLRGRARAPTGGWASRASTCPAATRPPSSWAGTTPTRTSAASASTSRPSSAAVVGNGNVAMDLARILASSPEVLAATDIAEHALDALERATGSARSTSSAGAARPRRPSPTRS